MHGRRAGTLRLAVVLTCIMALSGHICAPGDGGHVVRQSNALMIVAHEDSGHDASCEALARLLLVPSCPTSDTPTGTSIVPAVQTLDGRQAPAPILRPPRFILFASLLN
jgi:hypothetical protein